jgi:hypothetical protein
MIGRLLLTKLQSVILAPDPTKGVTKLILVLGVGADAEAAGFKVGDVVVPRSIGNIFLHGGTKHIAFCETNDVLFTVEGLSPEDVIDGNGKTEIRSLDPHDVSHQVAPS